MPCQFEGTLLERLDTQFMRSQLTMIIITAPNLE